MWAELLNVCKTESANMSQKLSAIKPIKKEFSQREKVKETSNCDSVIDTHLLKHPNCALHYNDDQFSILSKARSEFHLAVLESIHNTSSKPALCRQKEFVYRLKLST